MNHQNVKAGFFRDGFVFSRAMEDAAKKTYCSLDNFCRQGEIGTAMICIAAAATTMHLKIRVPDCYKDLNKFLYGMQIGMEVACTSCCEQ